VGAETPRPLLSGGSDFFTKTDQQTARGQLLSWRFSAESRRIGIEVLKQSLGHDTFCHPFDFREEGFCFCTHS
jgi:hypothetical protein